VRLAGEVEQSCNISPPTRASPMFGHVVQDLKEERDEAFRRGDARRSGSAANPLRLGWP
jgi:hypothetical protein